MGRTARPLHGRDHPAQIAKHEAYGQDLCDAAKVPIIGRKVDLAKQAAPRVGVKECTAQAPVAVAQPELSYRAVACLVRGLTGITLGDEANQAVGFHGVALERGGHESRQSLQPGDLGVLELDVDVPLAVSPMA